MSKKISTFFIDIAYYLIGCFVYSCAVTMFISPNEISPGGITGIATVLNHLFMLPTGIVVFLLNVPLIILGFIKFGGVFIVKTSVATAILSVMIELTDSVLPSFEIDKILAAVFGGILAGAGLSLVIMRGATTGGVDIVAKLINRRFPHFTVGRIILLSDALVVAFATFAYRNIESALYSIVSLYASSILMDTILYGADKGKIIYLISEKTKEISDSILQELQRGVTLLDVVGGYTGTGKKMIMCTVRRHEVSTVYRIATRYDPKAFIVVGEAGEIIGEGFKSIK